MGNRANVELQKPVLDRSKGLHRCVGAALCMRSVRG